MTARDGSRRANIAGIPAALFSFVDGVAPTADDQRVWQQTADCLASLHGLPPFDIALPHDRFDVTIATEVRGVLDALDDITDDDTSPRVSVRDLVQPRRDDVVAQLERLEILHRALLDDRGPTPSSATPTPGTTTRSSMLEACSPWSTGTGRTSRAPSTTSGSPARPSRPRSFAGTATPAVRTTYASSDSSSTCSAARLPTWRPGSSASCTNDRPMPRSPRRSTASSGGESTGGHASTGPWDDIDRALAATA